MAKVTASQIDAWKKEHGDVFQISVADLTAYLKKPDRKTLGYALTAAKSDPLRLVEIILQNCWLAGDDAIKTDPAHLVSLAGQMDAIIGVTQAEVKKL